MPKIGVFDSGVGGLSVAQAMQRVLPNTLVVYADDRVHVPYGNRSADELLSFVLPILQKLEQEGCELIVIACNTVSTTIIEDLRKSLRVPLIALEPMIKPAAEQTKTGVIAVCATSGTLKSQRYAWLKETYAKDVKVLEPDCSTWASMIEQSQVNDTFIAEQMAAACEAGADVIVLGCTHYHWIEEKIKKMVSGRARVIQPEQAIIRRTKSVYKNTYQTELA